MMAITKSWIDENGKLVVQVIPAEQVYKREPLTDEQREEIAKGWRGRNWTVGDIIDAIEKANGIGDKA